jgi:hypothetical protein
MTPLYRDPWFTFHFEDDRMICRFHLEGVQAGRRVEVFKVDPVTGAKLGLLATASVGADGWVDLFDPIIVKAGEAFIAIPEPTAHVAGPDSLCETCRHTREIITPKNSRFLLCLLSVTDARYAKYPPQPVVRCEGHKSEQGQQ